MPKHIIALTDDRIAKLKPGAKRIAVYDPAVPGLAIRVQPSGHKTFVFGARYPNDDDFRRRELGQAGKMTLEDAREKARAWAKLIAAGIDPRDEEERAERAKQIAAGNTFAAVAEDFIRRRLKGQRKAEVVAREIRTELVKPWGARPITDITRRDVVELIEVVADRGKGSGAYAHNIFGHVRSLFDWSINRGVYGLGEVSPTDRLKPAKLIGPKKVRQRVLDDDELRALWRASAHFGYPFCPVVRMLMLTGARLTEVTEVSWTEFNSDKALWTVPAERFKMDAEHIVPMTADLVALLETVPRWLHGDYLFTLTEGRKPVAFSSKAKARLDRRMVRTWRAVARLRGVDRRKAKLDHWTLHDIRRTVRTRLSELRIPEPIAEMVIGHSKKGLARVYNQHQYLNEMREALDAWAARLRSIVDPPPDNVVPMTGRERKKLTRA